MLECLNLYTLEYVEYLLRIQETQSSNLDPETRFCVWGLHTFSSDTPIILSHIGLLLQPLEAID